MDKVKETGQEALDRGKQVAQEVASTATETAKQQTQQQGQELADTARQHAQDVRTQCTEPDNGQARAAAAARAAVAADQAGWLGHGALGRWCPDAGQRPRRPGGLVCLGVVNRPGFRLCWRIQVAGRGWDSRASREVSFRSLRPR